MVLLILALNALLDGVGLNILYASDMGGYQAFHDSCCNNNNNTSRKTISEITKRE